MRKKGQAAMEFLMTYGWAILAAIIVIGVLAFYFRPSDLGAGKSNANTPWYLTSANAISGTAGNADLNLDLRWDGDGAINVNMVNVTDTGFGSCGVIPASAAGDTLSVGNSYTYTLSCTGAIGSGDAVQGSIAISYNKTSSPGIELKGTGKFSENAQ